ncbi:alpha-1,4-glucan--maltose-1-phosphate maltosyltransferase [Roseivirga sp. BDSF3-8]|uniref:alpha-1,4-glucan--maltose-1-phosphate maltosyltransferase n=1 Tax=Roseivirga sp. BDSF3-8 TaxID=3241598 RepID=UPI003531F750
MQELQGTRRVIIENVHPDIHNGLFPAKRVSGEKFTVSADIFSDGHDLVAGAMKVRAKGKRNWTSYRMEHLENDRWQASFIPEDTGFYEYTVQAWVDHFTTWQNGFRKKYQAGQDMKVELLIGAELLEGAINRANKDQLKKLKQFSDKLKDTGNPNAIDTALSDEARYLMDDIPAEHVSEYGSILTLEVERKKALFSTWYEFFPRSAAAEPGKHGTFKDCERLLPRVAEMGFDVLYFPPIHPIGNKHRKGRNNSLDPGPNDPGSPWAIGNEKGGHKSIHPELGNMADFKRLVKKAKDLDIEIALDIAYQCAPDHPWVKEHPQWFKWRPDGTVQYAENPPKKYQDILPINFETEDWINLWKELKSVIDFWIDQGVTIFRVDNPHTKAFPFWQWVIAAIRREHPGIIFLAEAFTRPRVMERLAKAGFNQSYTYFTWRNNPAELQEYMEELTESELRDYFRPNFWPNTPDILPPEITYGGEASQIARVVLAATLSSNYGLYGPVYEFGLREPHPDREEYIDSEKYEIRHWDWDQYTRIGDVITRINAFRKEEGALQQTANIHFAPTHNPSIICYGKYDEATNSRVIVAVNMDYHHTQGGMVKIPLKELNLSADYPYEVFDILSGATYDWQGEWNFVDLNPHSMPAHVFRVRQEGR